MWSFRRKQQADQPVETTESPEVNSAKDIYQPNSSQSMGRVWLVSIATFIVTALFVLGLFWFGQWAWNAVTKDDEPTNTPTTQGTDQTEQKAAGDQPAPSTPAPSNSGSSTGNTAPAGGNATPSTPAQTPSTGPTVTDLPRTGPASDE